MTVSPPVTIIVDLLNTENVAWCTPRTLANVEITPARELSVPGLGYAKVQLKEAK